MTTTTRPVTIWIHQNEDNLYAETEGIDVHKSTDRYVEMLTNAIQCEYPNVEVDIEVHRNTIGYSRSPEILNTEDFETEQELLFAYERISERIWGGFEWIVYEEA